MHKYLLKRAAWDVTRFILLVGLMVSACALAIWMGVRNPFVALSIILGVIFVFAVAVRYHILSERAYPKYPGGF